MTLLIAVFIGFYSQATAAEPEAKRTTPNILLILVDDMGYGDPQCFNPESRLKTPAIDRLAREGLMFRDAHAPHATCVASRYGLLTGRYPMRESFRSISPDKLTLPGLLKRNGYDTAMVGKWHVGFDNFTGNGGTAKPTLTGGPVDRGFDEFFGLWGSLDQPPYFYMKDRTPVKMPTEDGAGKDYWSKDRFYNGNWLPGKAAPGFKHVEVTPRLTAEAIKHIEKSADNEKPFFLYFAMPSPHGPWVPTEEFKGSSPIGVYGDFAQQVDHSIGQVLDALDDNGITENTLVIFTSDNGPVWYQRDRLKHGHSSASIYSGMKGDLWEGGHRMPFVLRWPAQVSPGIVSDSMIGFTDIMATFADLVGDDFPEAATTDSLSFLPILKGDTGYQVRETLIVNAGAQAFRQQNWKLITRKGPGGFTHWKGNRDEGPEGQLYDLAVDPSERNNLWDQMPEKVEELRRMLEAEKSNEK
jgi:arylsulfatase A